MDSREKLYLNAWMKLKSKTRLSLWDVIKLQHPMFYIFSGIGIFGPLYITTFIIVPPSFMGACFTLSLIMFTLFISSFARSIKVIPIQLKYLDWDKVPKSQATITK